MVKPIAWEQRRTERRVPPRAAIVRGLFLGASAAGVVATLIARMQTANAALTTAVAIFAASLALSAQQTWRWYRGDRADMAWCEIVRGAKALRCLAGAFIAYLCLLPFGPQASLGWVWLSLVNAWWGLVLLPLTAVPNAVADWRQWTQNHTPRQAGWLVTAMIALAIGGELALQALSLAGRQDWTRLAETPVQTQPAVLTDLLDESSDDLRLDSLPAGPFRVAIVGDDSSVNSATQAEYLARIQQMLPGVKLTKVAAPPPVAGDPLPGLTEELAVLRPDLVLMVLPICQQLSQAPAAADWFDWRQWQLARWAGFERPAATNASHDTATLGGGEFERFLGTIAPQLATCRTPLTAEMDARWRQVTTSLDRAIVGCRQQGVPMAVVMIPGEFQVNGALSETLMRRAGLTAEKFDFDLPQRRVAAHANQRQIPYVDLLPHLRLSREPVYARHAATWNHQGHAVVAAAIGGWLQSSYGSQLAVIELTTTP